MKLIYCLMAATMISLSANAQDGDKKEKKSTTITLGSDGIKVNDKKIEEKPEKKVDLSVGMVDIGINSIIDNTNYGSTEAKSFLQVPQSLQNENLFSMRTGKSWNVNVYPVMVKMRLHNGKKQRIYFSTGIGLQMYNFRYTKNISFRNETVPMVVMDTISFSKNKIGLTYLNIPLQFTFKTKLADKAWLVYGVGATGGYRIASWNKQVSPERGKQKNRDEFNFNDFNACVTGEIGLDNVFRLFASYQLTPLHSTALDQRPFTIGLRFGGI